MHDDITLKYHHTLLLLGTAAWNEEEYVQLPKHLFVHNSPKDFWLGVCMLITAMDANCIRSRLMNTTGGHQDLVENIVAALKYEADKDYSCHHRKKVTSICIKMTSEKANATIFWPAMQCLAILLDRLGSRFWQFALCTASSVLKSILSNPFFHFELKRWALNGKDEDETTSSELESEMSASEDDWITNSQMVYDWDGETPSPCSSTKTTRRQTEMDSPELFITTGRNSAGQLRVATFSWIIPFVQSLLDFGSMMSDTIGSVFTALHSIYTKSMAGDKNFEYFDINSSPITTKDPSISKLTTSVICNESLLTLSRLVELIFSKEGFIILLNFQRKWLPLVTKALSVLLCSSKSTSHPASGFQRTLDLQICQPHPSSLSHIVTLSINILNSAEARGLPKSNVFLSAVSSFSPKVQPSTSVQPTLRHTSTASGMSPLHRKAIAKATTAPRQHELSDHFLTILRKCHESQGSFNLFASLCQSASPSNTQSQRSPSEQPHNEDMEVCEQELVSPEGHLNEEEHPSDVGNTVETDYERSDKDG